MPASELDNSPLLENLVRIYSPSYREREAVTFFVSALGEMDLVAFRDEAGNAIGIRGEGPREVVLIGHIDTAPGIVEVRREDGQLYGRGTVDAKGPLCAFAAAAARVTPPPGWRTVVVGAVEEECPTSKGARYAGTQYAPQFAVVGEPSGWDRVTLGYKGSLWTAYTLRRPMGHSAARRKSAAEEAVEFWVRVKSFAGEFNADKDRLFDRLDLALRDLHSDDDGLYETVRLAIGLRLPPGLTVAGLEARIRELAEEATVEFSTETPAFRADKNNALVRAFLSSIRQAGGDPAFNVKTGTSDMNLLGPLWNCPIVTYGPGDSNFDHAPDEHIDLAEYARSIDVLAQVVENLMN